MLIRLASLTLLLLVSACSLDSGVPVVTQQELLSRISNGEKLLLLDVRTTGEYAEGYIPGALHIDHREIDHRISEIATYKNAPVIVYCFSGMRAAMVESSLIEAGFSKVYHLQGDWSAWRDAGLPFKKPGA